MPITISNTVTGNILQLSAGGVQNARMGIRNVAHDYHTYESIGLQPITLESFRERLADIATFETLELSFTEPDRIENNLINVKKLELVMEIGGEIVQQFPLSLLINLNEPIICERKMYINLCFDMFFGPVKLIGLHVQRVTFKIRNINTVNGILNYGIVSKLTYLDQPESRYIVENPCEQFIQQISFIEIKANLNDINATSNIYDMNNLEFPNVLKGFFIECHNVDFLNNIRLKFNDHDRFNLNKFLITTKCKKINQHLLYFPFNYDMCFLDRTASSYEGSANLFRINVNLTLTFCIPTNNVKIYCLNANIYRQMRGLGGLAYDIFGNDTYDLFTNRLLFSNRLTRPIQIVGTSIAYSGPTNKKIIDINDSICPILCEPIATGDRYMCCHKCKHNFTEQGIKQWLEGRRAEKRTCPLCRVKWSNFEIYINNVSVYR